MTEEELIGALSDRWQEHFADEMARRVCAAEAVGVLYRIAAGPDDRLGTLPKPERRKIGFRAAYVLERVSLRSWTAFLPFAEDFCRRAFPACTDPSVRRHFRKIMIELLRRVCLDPEVLERIAETAAEWAVEPGSKVAVRVWAMEVLKVCRGRIGWVDECWEDLVEAQAAGASPGIVSRLRRSWR
ncbi:MAG TPA: hypothetical protein H9828_08460 [Candidatus Alistipes intestinigallinarum]|uniref:Uncharacterized protein n=1 Tax=Candidatus Alistipes intestinigallinarum TaxID=2838440 RepID=A0A9D1Z2D8_9BACT|nr:hypothetical protein [Candidatus Alistipes intestinigallinarum]